MRCLFYKQVENFIIYFVMINLFFSYLHKRDNGAINYNHRLNNQFYYDKSLKNICWQMFSYTQQILYNLKYDILVFNDLTQKANELISLFTCMGFIPQRLGNHIIYKLEFNRLLISSGISTLSSIFTFS